MPLFQNAVLNKYLSGIKDKQVEEAWENFTAHFHNAEIQENIRDAKEEEYQGGFLEHLFVNVLGYTMKPAPNYNLVAEKKNLNDSKKADGALLDGDKVRGVIELKGTETTDLGKVETQAFGYKNKQPDALYVIISNFEKLRFYIDNAVDFIEFNLFTLTKEDFKVLWLCLAYPNFTRDIPKKIKDDSLEEEESVTKKLYKDYSNFKQALFEDIVDRNPDYDKVLLFKKTQKLLDRFLFIFFAEDRNLVPYNFIRRIIQRWTELRDDYDVEVTLYDRFKKIFQYLNEGHSGKEYDVFAYNGGLFLEDELLDGLSISDEILYEHTDRLSNYDFESEVDVNILGHIFEHSLNEIEEINAELKGEEVDTSKTRRKKDGVFYTPKYITKYIVEHTVGKLCEEQKAELDIDDEDYRPNRQKKTKKALLDKLEAYREWLLELTICDPACGSGAFLNQALEFLIAEHTYVDELQAKLLGESMVLPDVENQILERNLFGVDINEESVEIAKLSLWLRTAQKGRKLTSLNHNIKCGNSLIDDPEVAGDKAFDWEAEFPSVFENGGFDVVIGNPPYVKLETIKETSTDLEKQGYETFTKRGDLYAIFVEKGFDLLKPKGIYSYIMPNKWLQAGYGKPLREFFLTKELIQFIDFGDLQIFEGATTYPCIFVARNDEPKDEFDVAVLVSAGEADFNTNVLSNLETFATKEFSGKTWVISSKRENELLEKLNKALVSLDEYVGGNANYGIKTGFTKGFMISEEEKNELIEKDSKAKEIINPVLRGRDIKKWVAKPIEKYLISTFPAFSLDIDDYPSVKEYLLKFGKKRLEQSGEKGSRKKSSGKWFETQDSIEYWELFHKPKIMYQKFQVSPCFIYDEQGLYCNDSMWIIPTEEKSLLGILNSKMGWWLITKYCTQIRGGCQLIWKYFGQIPIPELNGELDDLVEQMIELNNELQKHTDALCDLLQSKFDIEKLSRKLQSWHELTFKQFLKELKKKKVKLTLEEEAEWMDYFQKQKSRADELKTQIAQTDSEIDEMVYGLYGLNKEEIEVVEGS
ncbi:Eco57I restriction-modification methylase domain-containing protein [Gracilimonas amylolytica]|uniref:Eco57I restriction-modification methylase domain-containing protein n=1 Tax=Gracilimonas amylolytica TaxID=1749045 RepID=UPI000CD849A1|nr:N-6 DNA methylase [Gracilimonas amylolytica]